MSVTMVPGLDLPSGIFSGSFSEVLENPSAGLPDSFGLPQYNSQDSYLSVTSYTLKIDADGTFSLSRAVCNDCGASLEDLQNMKGILASSAGSSELKLTSMLSEKMCIENGTSLALTLRALVEGAGPGAAPHEEGIVMSLQKFQETPLDSDEAECEIAQRAFKLNLGSPGDAATGQLQDMIMGA
mmetsp:Transcript_82195/g.150680  ORF Transcript_82195/g.150680 Transcript_82195/m.150680 type:complete len:184 (+) Transcript_82195:35-586(+)